MPGIFTKIYAEIIFQKNCCVRQYLSSILILYAVLIKNLLI